MPREVSTAPIGATAKEPARPGWPTDPSEFLTYYRSLLKELLGLEDELKSVTGDPKLQWSDGQLAAMTRLPSDKRERAMQVQAQLASLREEKASIERMIPGIIKLRQDRLSAQVGAQKGGMSPSEAQIWASSEEKKGLEGMAASMPSAQSGAPTAVPMGREMLEAEFGPMSDADWNAYRSNKLGLPTAQSADPYAERTMALREQEFAFQKQQYADEMARAQQQQAQQMQDYRNSILQQAFENQMAQRRLQAQAAGDMAGLRQQAWGQGMPWAVPGGSEYMPNFGPGGLAQQVAAGAGINLAPVPIARWDAPDPSAYYRQLGLLSGIPIPQLEAMMQQQQPRNTVNLPLVMNGGR
jgi:predicted transcriptional regulator